MLGSGQAEVEASCGLRGSPQAEPLEHPQTVYNKLLEVLWAHRREHRTQGEAEEAVDPPGGRRGREGIQASKVNRSR